jgi:hypothetical protein
MSEIRRAGETVWIYPQDHPLADRPNGFGFFLAIVHGPAAPRDPYSDKILTTGYVFDERIGRWESEPIPLVISRRQPLASRGPAGREERRVTARHRADTTTAPTDLPDIREYGGRTYRRVS